MQLSLVKISDSEIILGKKNYFIIPIIPDINNQTIFLQRQFREHIDENYFSTILSQIKPEDFISKNREQIIKESESQTIDFILTKGEKICTFNITEPISIIDTSYFLLRSQKTGQFDIILFQENADHDIELLNCNIDFSLNFVVIDSFVINVQLEIHIERIQNINKFYSNRKIDIDFIYILTGHSEYKFITGNKLIDQNIYLNIDSEELHRLSLTNDYVKDIINTASFVEDFLSKNNLDKSVILDKNQWISYFDFWLILKDLLINKQQMNFGDYIKDLQDMNFQNLIKSSIYEIKENSITDFQLLFLLSKILDEDLFKIVVQKTSLDEVNTFIIYAGFSTYERYNLIKICYENGIKLNEEKIDEFLLYLAVTPPKNPLLRDEFVTYIKQKYNR